MVAAPTGTAAMTAAGKAIIKGMARTVEIGAAVIKVGRTGGIATAVTNTVDSETHGGAAAFTSNAGCRADVRPSDFGIENVHRREFTTLQNCPLNSRSA